MSKASKNKNGKVPKITEAEYAAYLSSLKATENDVPSRVDKTCIPPVTERKSEN